MDKNNMKAKLKKYIVEEIMKNEDYSIRDDEPLITNGLINSFSLVQIAVFIEEEFQVKIPDTDLTVENMDTINDMTARIEQEMGAQ
jgi:acyl carrier protein